jgi:hypothetical protein
VPPAPETTAGGPVAVATEPIAYRFAAPEPVPGAESRAAARIINDEDRVAEIIAPSSNALALLYAFRHSKAELTPDYLREINLRPVRASISEATPIDWDDTPTINQSVSIAHGHLLHWRQTWRSDGYSLGDLLYSLPLAAGQKRRVAIVDWERTDLASRGEQTYFDEALRNMATHDRELSEVVRGAIREGISGGSRALSLGFGTGSGGAASGTVNMMNLGGVFGISGGAGYADASSFQNSARQAAADSAQNLRELTMQSASATRGVRSTTVVSIGEEETARATTEVVANHNHCHAITVQYFEVLRHLRVDTELADVQECLFVPLTIRPFDPNKVRRWRKELTPAVRDPELTGAFDAIERVATEWQLSGFPLGSYAEEQVQAIRGDLRIMLSAPVPPAPPDLTLQKLAIENAAAAGTAALEAANASLNATPDWMKGVQTFLTLGGSDMAREGAVASTNAAIDNIQRQAEYQLAMLDRAPSERSRHDFFFTHVMPRFFASFVDQLSLVVTDENGSRKLDVDFTLVDNYVPGSPLRVTFNAPQVSGVTRAAIRSLTVRSELPLPSGCRAIAYGINAEYATANFEHRLVDQPRVVDDIDCGEFEYSDTNVDTVSLAKRLSGPGLTVRCPVDAWEQRRPRFEDIRLAAALLDHLNDHLEQYHQELWWSMDPNRRFMLLDGFVGPNGRSLASCIDNRLMAIVGNSLVFPVARGLNLDPTIRATGDTKQLDLLSRYRPAQAVLPYRISFPTRGVFAESVMGSCNSCEDIDDSKNWRWEESPIDDVPAPTADTGSRRVEVGGLVPTQPPSPIISQQTPTEVPDPAGLAALIGLLGSVNFRDAAGLAGTQANAAAAYAKAMDTALAFGQEASKLAQQAAMTKNLGQTTRAIETAKEQGKISDEDETRHTNNTLDRLTMTPPPLVEAEMEGSDPSEWEPWPGETPKPKKPGKPKGKTIPVEIALRLFVPAELWIPFAGSPIAFNGDSRGFGLAGHASRIEMGYTFELDASTFAVTKPVAKPVTFGVARVYKATDAVSVAGRPFWWMAKQNDAVAPLGQMAMEDAARRFEPEPIVRTDRYAVVFRMNDQPYFPWEGSLPKFVEHIPIIGGLADAVAEAVTSIANPNIDFNIMVSFVNEHDGVPRLLVSGTHNMFPAYEVYVNGEEVYRWGAVAQFVGEPVLGLNREQVVVDPRPLRTMKVK